MFNQSLFGFDRSQVLKYIDDMSAQMSRQAREYAKKQTDLQEEIEKLSGQVSRISDEFSISAENADKLKNDLQILKQNNDELKRQVSLYRAMITERDTQIELVKGDISAARERQKALADENARWKSKQDEIAACMVEAHMRAKEIIQSADEEAARRKRQFNDNAARLLDKVEDFKVEIADLERQLNDSFEKLNTAMRNMDKAGNIIENQVKEYQRGIRTIDIVKPDDREIAGEKHTYAAVKPVAKAGKKTLTDAVLDSISKLLDR